MVCGDGCETDLRVCPVCRIGLERAEQGRPRRRVRSQLDSLSAAFEYEGVARAAVRSLKYDGRVALAEEMARLMIGRAQSSIDFTRCVLVPVPSHPDNRRRRGFDQAVLIARALSSATGVPLAECLERRGLRGTQTGLGRAARLAVPEGEFIVGRHSSRHRGADPLADFPTNVVVCDDVTTTTCTLEACASAIRERCEVQTIHGLTFASASATQ